MHTATKGRMPFCGYGWRIIALEQSVKDSIYTYQSICLSMHSF